ncbi:uncharacterized protein LOC126990441, partial [Eriocheir sinensis]|uniref:uncharacterized protein LOC126990441 n=1 Tax=Eriocheir sinensis TaxID=95602 RepID=UPI0021C8E4B8
STFFIDFSISLTFSLAPAGGRADPALSTSLSQALSIYPYLYLSNSLSIYLSISLSLIQEEEKVLPVIDLSLAKGHTRAGLVKELHEALTTVGFIYLKNVDGYDEEALLRHSKWFFSLPMEQRMAISKKSFNPKCSNEYRGYFPVIPGAVSHKEAFEIGPKQGKPKEGLISLEEKFIIEDNQWPLESRGIRGGQEIQGQTWMEVYHEKMTEASRELLSLIAEGYGAPSDFFADIFRDPHLSTLRLIRYPARPNTTYEARDGDAVIQTAEHQDTTMVTLPATFAEYPGLQVRWWKDDSIIDVTHKPGHLVMNIGQLLSYTSGGALKATKHRVIDCCGDRLSVPFILEPRFHANVNVVLPGCEQRESQPKYYGHWLLEGIRKWAEYKDLCRRIETQTAKTLYEGEEDEDEVMMWKK